MFGLSIPPSSFLLPVDEECEFLVTSPGAIGLLTRTEWFWEECSAYSHWLHNPTYQGDRHVLVFVLVIHPIKMTKLVYVPSFQVLPTIQLLIPSSMQKRRGKAWSILSRQCLPRVHNQKDAFCTHVLCFEPRAVHFLLHEHSKLQCLRQKLQDQASSSFFREGTPPPLSR